MATIRDVAAHAGVSFKTVARVVNNEPGIRDITRDKVLRSIEALNYRPNISAKMMRKQKSGIIGIIMETNESMAPAVDIIQAAQEFAREKNKLVISANVKENSQSKNKAIEQLLNLRVEGIIYTTMYHRPVLLPEECKEIPIVLANCFCPNNELPSVVPNEYQAGFELTKKMIDKGYKRIAFLNLNQRIIAASERLRGYHDALSLAGLKIDDVYIHNVEIERNGVNIHITTQILDKVMALPEKPDAIICGKDQLAIETYLYLARHGLEVQKDIGIGSFDNMECITFSLKPKLSTMDLPHAKMGEIAMDYLLSGNQSPLQQKVDWTFIEGESF